MLTIYTMAYNEETILQFMIDHYRSRFPNCNIIIRDNESTDRTREIAAANSCSIIDYKTNGKIDDFELRDLKNNCWKNAQTDWVLVCDPDELLFITQDQLLAEEALGTTIIKTEGYNLVNMEDNYNIKDIKYGIRDVNFDKLVLFNKNFINEINYHCGAHTSSPIGNIQYSQTNYKLCHFKFIHIDYLVNRLGTTSQRISENNKKYGMGSYNFWEKEKIKNTFDTHRQLAKKIL